MKSDWKFAAAESLGVIVLLAAMLGHILLMGSETVSGAGLFLISITIVGYLIFTWLSQNRSSKKRYWIMYVAKIAFTAALLLFAPLISKLLARLING